MKLIALNKPWVYCLFSQVLVCACLHLPAAAGETKPDSRKIYKIVDTALKQEVSHDAAKKPGTDQREAIVRKTFNAGQAYYDRGDYDSALDQWEKIVPLLPEDHELAEEIDRFKRIWDRAKLSKAPLTNSEQIALFDKIVIDQSVKKISELLAEASGRLEAQIREVHDREAKAKQDIAAKQAFVQSVFEKGKSLYDQGKILEAVAEWNAISSYMRDSSKFKAALQEVQENYQRAETAKKTVGAAADKDRITKVPALDAFDVLLSETNNKLNAQIQDAAERQKKAEGSILAKQNFVLATFEKGNALYNKDKVSEAIGEWVQLIPYLDDEELKAAIRTAQTSYGLSEQARRSADEAESKNDHAQFKSPDDLNHFLTGAADKFRTQIRQSNAREAKAHAALLTKEAFVRSTLEKSLELYHQGKMLEAMMAWNDVLPYLEDGTVIRDFETNFIASEKARKTADEAVAMLYSTKFQMPENLRDSLKAANTQLKLKTQEAKIQTDLAAGRVTGIPLKKGEIEETAR